MRCHEEDIAIGPAVPIRTVNNTWHAVANRDERGGTIPDRVFPDQTAHAALCRRHAIRRLSLFGSMQKGTSRPDSDVGLLVEFSPGSEPGLLRLAGIEAEFSALLNGRRVDRRTAPDLSARFRDDVLRTALAEFAA
jgi:predicted nucleotidyltransferase